MGSPPETFVWEYYDKNKKYVKMGPITPLEFYKTHVKPHFNMEDKVRGARFLVQAPINIF